MIEILLGVIGGGAALALLLTIYTLLVHQRVPDTLALKRQTDNLQLSHNDLFERFERYQRRQNTRTMRENAADNVGKEMQVVEQSNLMKRLAAKIQRTHQH